jgi:hypothetical protein
VRLVRVLFGAGSFVVLLGTIVTAAGPHAGGEGTGDNVTRLQIFGDDTFKTAIMVTRGSPRRSGSRACSCGCWRDGAAPTRA